jgi:peroxidase
MAILLSVLMMAPANAAAVAKVAIGDSYADGESGPVDYYPADGRGVNSMQPEWGAADTLLARVEPSTHDPNASWMGLSDLPGPRLISNAVCAQPGVIADERGLSDFNWLWGQFITHEIDFTLTQNGRVGPTGEPEHADIVIAADDPWMPAPGGSEMQFFRSLYVNETHPDGTFTREHPNSITTWIDGGVVYGADQTRADWLRTFEGGRLKVSVYEEGDLLPIGDSSSPGMSFGGFSADVRFVAGDARANEHIALMAMHVLFMREHNRLADEIAVRNPDWSDEDIYQRGRKLVAAQIQAITYEEFLPSLGIVLADYQAYDDSVDPTITSAFATVAFRMGHSQIGDTFLRVDEGRENFDNMDLFDGFWTTKPVTDEGGIAPLMRGMAMSVQPANDVFFGEDLRNKLFGIPGAGGMDLCAIDIQRGRDHGVPDYGTIRGHFGLEPITDYSNITSDSEIAASLSLAYGDADPGHIDPLIGMLAEDHLEDSALGVTMDALIRDQFTRLRDGDPLYYENDAELSEVVKVEIATTRLSDVILRNTEIESIQCNVFFAEHTYDAMDCNHANADISSSGDSNEAGMSSLVLGLLIIGVAGLIIMGTVGVREADSGPDEED